MVTTKMNSGTTKITPKTHNEKECKMEKTRRGEYEITLSNELILILARDIQERALGGGLIRPTPPHLDLETKIERG